MSHVIEILENKIKELKYKEYNLEYKKDLDYLKTVHHLLGDNLTSDIIIGVSGENISFYQNDSDDNYYPKEVFSIRLERDWKTKEISNIQTSAYSTSDSRNFELIRLINLGNVAKFLLNGGKEVLKMYWMKEHKLHEELKNIKKQRWDLEREVEKLEKKEKEKKEIQRINLLKIKGLKFEYGDLKKEKKTPYLPLKYNKGCNNITSLKILRESGKSVDIEVVYEFESYNQDTQQYEWVSSEKLIIKRVKFDNIKYFLNSAIKYSI